MKGSKQILLNLKKKRSNLFGFAETVLGTRLAVIQQAILSDIFLKKSELIQLIPNQQRRKKILLFDLWIATHTFEKIKRHYVRLFEKNSKKKHSTLLSTTSGSPTMKRKDIQKQNQQSTSTDKFLYSNRCSEEYFNDLIKLMEHAVSFSNKNDRQCSLGEGGFEMNNLINHTRMMQTKYDK